MADSKKQVKKTAPISDVEQPGKTAASPTSKPIIVTNRPLIKDPMVMEDDKKDEVVSKTPVKKTSTKPKIQPLDTSLKSDGPDVQKDSNDDAKEASQPDEKTKSDKKNIEQDEKLETKRKAEHEANLQKVVAAKTYYLPINAVEKRKTKRFVALGILLSILLIMIWVNIALDAELIQIDGIMPLTSFF